MKIFFNRVTPIEIFKELLKKRALPIPPNVTLSEDNDMGFFFSTFNQLDYEVVNALFNEEKTTLFDAPVFKWDWEVAGSSDHNNTITGGSENIFISEELFFGLSNINGSVTWMFDSPPEGHSSVYWRTVRGNHIKFESYEDSLYKGTTIEIISKKYSNADAASAKLVFDIMGKLSEMVTLIYERE